MKSWMWPALLIGTIAIGAVWFKWGGKKAEPVETSMPTEVQANDHTETPPAASGNSGPLSGVAPRGDRSGASEQPYQPPPVNINPPQGYEPPPIQNPDPGPAPYYPPPPPTQDEALNYQPPTYDNNDLPPPPPPPSYIDPVAPPEEEYIPPPPIEDGGFD